MVKYCSILLLFLGSCSQKLHKNANGEPIIPPGSYTFKKKMTAEDSKLIDTTALYVQVFDKDANESERSNPKIIIFESDGFYKISSVKFHGKYTRSRESVYYGGKFYLEGNTLFTEAFYPIGDATNRYSKEISKGVVNGDTVSIVTFGNELKYVRKDYAEVFK